MQKVQCHKTTPGPSVYCLFLLYILFYLSPPPQTSVRNESFWCVFSRTFFAHKKRNNSNSLAGQLSVCSVLFRTPSVVHNFRIHFYVFGPTLFSAKKLTSSFPGWIYSPISAYMRLTWNRPVRRHPPWANHNEIGWQDGRMAGWPKETCRIIAKHFLLPFRTPRVFFSGNLVCFPPYCNRRRFQGRRRKGSGYYSPSSFPRTRP